MKTRMIELLVKPESQQPQQIEEEKVEGTIKRRRRRSPIWFQGLALSITNRSIAKPYNSSKVCFDLSPRYADETCGPTNARHKKDSASFIDPKLWYKKTFITANKLYARKLVKEDPCVMTYVESAYSYVNEEITESCNQQTDVIRGINDGYRGLELFYHPRSVWIEEMSCARAKVVNFANKAKYNKSNDVDLCIFSEKLTYWDRIIANRMAQADAIAASI